MTIATFSLRRAVAADAPAMWALRAQAIRETCRSHYPSELLERWSSSPLPDTFPSRIESEYFIVGTVESRVAGFATLKVSSAEIEAVFVSPDAGRRGLGRALLANLEGAALAGGLHSLGLHSSLNAVPFYQAMGYTAISESTYTTSQGLEIACVHMRKAFEAGFKR
jgi:GNAT superfamily N-acetyltransferase